MPRLHWKQVSQEITAVTGIEVVDVSWQPCGHKEITICHAESHYDMHLYYVKNPIDDPRCKGNSKEKAKDGIEWWMPRLHWKQVSQEITAVTGIEVGVPMILIMLPSVL